jgi:hypothetical protein
MSLEDKRIYDDKNVNAPEHLDLARRPSVAVGADVAQARDLLNPLHGIPKETLLADVDTFCAETGMTDHVEVFKRGALVAQKPLEYETISELNEEDLFWLRKSTASKWSQPRMLYFTGEQ